MTSEPRTPSTPQSLAQLRDAVLAEHKQVQWDKFMCKCGWAWPCQRPAYRLATALSPENVAVGLRTRDPDDDGNAQEPRVVNAGKGLLYPAEVDEEGKMTKLPRYVGRNMIDFWTTEAGLEIKAQIEAEAESSLRARLAAEVRAAFPKDPRSTRILVDRAAVLQVIEPTEPPGLEE